MKKRTMEKVLPLLAVLSTACTAAMDTSIQESAEPVQESTETSTETPAAEENTAVKTETSASAQLIAAEIFTERDLQQSADTSNAVRYTANDNDTLTITEEGVYVLSGSAENYTVRVEAEDADKVQLVLDGLNVTNTDAPVIYILSADKVFITTTSTDNTLTVTGEFAENAEEDPDAVIFAKDDVVLNGTGTLNISSSENGISGKDDLKITGGTYVINSEDDAIEANDSVAIADGSITIVTSEDGIHSEYDDDDSVGYVYIGGGNLSIEAGDDGIHATTILQIDDGTLKINAAEALEGTYIQINGGDITINAGDDGINAAHKSTLYTPTLEINGGNLDITIGAGDTDALDSNGNLIINGGYINISAQSAFDYDGQGSLNGDTVIVNGTQITTLTNSMMGGMGQMPGGMQGEMPEGGMQGQMPGGQFPGGEMQGPREQHGN